MIRSFNLESDNKYGKYFLALEDDGGTSSVKTKSVSVKVNNTKTDFSQGAGDIEEDPNESNSPDSGTILIVLILVMKQIILILMKLM